MIGIVVPAHDEEDSIESCVQSLIQASKDPQLLGEPVLVIVVLDSCSDATEDIVRKLGVCCTSVQARNVGVARAKGAQLALDAGARWLAFTDADSVVAPDWLYAHISQGADAVCGTVVVHDWGQYGERMRTHYANSYTDADGHQHIHGANLGISAAAYRAVGGFSPLESSEDVALVNALRHYGASISWTAAPRVVTSSRRNYRAPLGFGATLERIDREANHLMVPLS